MKPQKSRAVYIALALILGMFGIHNFYAERKSHAIAQLLITVVTFWLFLPLVAVAIWVICDVVSVDKDGSGRYMK